ncbi:hypothetical protein AAFN60_13780 [Roseibacillus persicicus]|uniref:hypothetical protein n=1 Tax=Roseibacillus persicicus TaxID=454148 RepID=UPI00398BBB7C
MGSAYLNRAKDPVIRPEVVREEDGEVELQLYKATRSQRNLFAEVVSAVSEAMSTRCIAQHAKGAASRSEASRMWWK